MKSVKSLATMLLMGLPVWIVLLGALQFEATSIQVHVDEPGVTVFIDSFPTPAESNVVGPIDVKPGEYRVQVVREGVPVFSRMVTVAAGEAVDVWAHWLARQGAAAIRQVPAIPAVERTMEGHFGTITGLVATDDGRTLYSTAADGTLRAWDVATGLARSSIPAHIGPVSGLSPIGGADRLLTAGDDGLIRVWDARTGASRRTQHAGTDVALRCSATTADGRYAAIGLVNGETIVLDLEAGRQATRIVHEPRAAAALAFSPDGSDLLISLLGPRPGSHRVELHDARTGALKRTFGGHSGPAWCLAFLPGGRVATGGSDRTVRIWDAETGREEAVLAEHPGAVFALTVSSDGTRLLAGTSHLWDGAGWSDADAYGVVVWDLAARAPVGRIETNGPVRAVAMSSDGRRIFAGGEDRVVRVWDTPRNVGLALESPEAEREADGDDEAPGLPAGG